MKSKLACQYALLIASAFLTVFTVHAQSANPNETLRQYIADLQKNPNDYTLREKIIRHVQTMRLKPAVPDEASKYMDRGVAAIEGAKGEGDFRAASIEFGKAVNLAPWLGDAYRNLAIAQDKSGQYDAAIKNLRLYLLTSPSPADEAWAKSLINKVEYRKEKAAMESSPAAMAEKKRQEEGAFLKKIDGARYRYRHADNRDAGYWILDIRGNQVVRGFIITWSKFSPEDVGRYQSDGAALLNGREFTLISPRFTCGFTDTKQVEKGRISDDGESITTQVCNETRTYRRER